MWGQDESRQMLDEAAIAANAAGISSVFDKFLKFGEGATDARMVSVCNTFDTKSFLGFKPCFMAFRR
jgi:tyrosyl-tRNA synthetase